MIPRSSYVAALSIALLVALSLVDLYLGPVDAIRRWAYGCDAK